MICESIDPDDMTILNIHTFNKTHKTKTDSIVKILPYL